MKEYTSKERNADIFILVAFLMMFVVTAILAMAGYSTANFGTTYVAGTEIVMMLVAMILPILRIKGIFRAPYWFLFAVNGCVCMHGLSLYLGFYQTIEIWSVIAHTAAGIVVSMIVFTGLSVIQTYSRAVNLGVYPLLFMTLIITMGFGGAWELMEWSVDRIAGVPYMSYSIFDTTDDLVSDIGGTLITIACAFYLVHSGKMVEVIESINLGALMRVVGAKWDRRCGMDVEIPEKNEKSSVEFGKWEFMDKSQYFENKNERDE